jgi:hypothetical protein
MKIMHTRKLVTTALLIAVLISPLAQAACSQYDGTGRNASAQLDYSHLTQCLGGSADLTKISKTVEAANSGYNVSQVNPKTREDVAVLQEVAAATIREIMASLRVVQQSASFEAPYARALREMAADAESIVRGEPHFATKWEYDNGLMLDDELDLTAYLGRACQVATSAVCIQGYEQAAGLVRHGALVAKVLKDSNVNIQDLTAAYKNLDKSWDYYFSEARSQYFWELGFNDRRFNIDLRNQCKKNLDPATSLSSSELQEYCDKRWDVYLSTPPTGQVIFLHPNASVEYVDSDDSGQSATRAVAIVELIGYNKFARMKNGRWEPMDWPIGGSIISTISLDGNGSQFGYGAMLHVKNNLSFGVARRKFSGAYETTWLMSVDLGALFLDVAADAKQKFRTLQVMTHN